MCGVFSGEARKHPTHTLHQGKYRRIGILTGDVPGAGVIILMGMDQYKLFIILTPISLALSIGILTYAWRRRKRPLARTLVLLMVPVCCYLITNPLELLDPTLAGTLFWAKCGYLSAPFIPVVWLAFAFDYTGRHKWLQLRRFWPFLIVPFLSALFAMTNEWHHLIWTETIFTQRSGFLTLSVSYGAWFWVNAVFGYLLLLSGMILVITEYILYFRSYRWQSLWVLLGMLIPLAAHFIYIYHLVPGWRKDYSPISFAFTGFAFAMGIFRFRLFSLAPIARSLVMDYMEDGICVLDGENKIVDSNQAFRRIAGFETNPLIGETIGDVIPFWKGLEIPAEPDSFSRVVDLPGPLGQLYFEMRIQVIYRWKYPLGLLITMHDITERKNLMNAIEQMAITDPLTGLYNRRYFTLRALEEVERSARLNHVMSIIMLDLDRFKTVNDTYGHAIGDRVLVAASEYIQTELRKIDILARYGGEEFVILLPETGNPAACQVAERICLAANDNPAITDVGEIPFSFSIGVASNRTDGTVCSLEELIQRADRAMYDAKACGRNQVQSYHEDRLLQAN